MSHPPPKKPEYFLPGEVKVCYYEEISLHNTQFLSGNFWTTETSTIHSKSWSNYFLEHGAQPDGSYLLPYRDCLIGFLWITNYRFIFVPYGCMQPFCSIPFSIIMKVVRGSTAVKSIPRSHQALCLELRLFTPTIVVFRMKTTHQRLQIVHEIARRTYAIRVPANSFSYKHLHSLRRHDQIIIRKLVPKAYEDAQVLAQTLCTQLHPESTHIPPALLAPCTSSPSLPPDVSIGWCICDPVAEFVRMGVMFSKCPHEYGSKFLAGPVSDFYKRKRVSDGSFHTFSHSIMSYFGAFPHMARYVGRDTPFPPPAALKQKIVTGAYSGWKISWLNVDYSLSQTYPAVVAVPVQTTDSIVKSSAKFRSTNRFPTLCWRSPYTGVSLSRCAQPCAGILGKSEGDEFYVNAMTDCCPARSVLYIFDARPRKNTVANTLIG
ncbi:Myotubularin family like protein, partial [Aduncisulcus paluster]